MGQSGLDPDHGAIEHRQIHPTGQGIGPTQPPRETAPFSDLDRRRPPQVRVGNRSGGGDRVRKYRVHAIEHPVEHRPKARTGLRCGEIPVRDTLRAHPVAGKIDPVVRGNLRTAVYEQVQQMRRHAIGLQALAGRGVESGRLAEFPRHRRDRETGIGDEIAPVPETPRMDCFAISLVAAFQDRIVRGFRQPAERIGAFFDRPGRVVGQRARIFERRNMVENRRPGPEPLRIQWRCRAHRRNIRRFGDAKMLSDSRSYCAAEVRRLDRERYLAALFAPAARRDALFALLAFNLETAKTAEVVSEPLLGEIRLQWWRDAVDGIYDGSVREHPVLAALAEAIETRGLERSRFHAILDGREADLREQPFDDLDALEDYVARTAVPLLELACQALGSESDETIGLAREAGLGLGLAGVLRAIPFHARQRRLFVPRSLMAEAGVSPAALFDRGPPKAFARAVEPIAARARAHVAALRRRRHDIPVAARAAFLPVAMSEAFLRRLARNGHDAFDARLGFSPLAVQTRIVWAAFARRYSAASDIGPRQRSRSISARLQ